MTLRLSPFSRVLAGLVLSGALGLPRPVLAQTPLVVASVSGQANGGIDSNDDTQESGSASAALVLGGMASNVSGTADASFGVLRSFANAQLEHAGGTSPTTTVSSLSSWKDLVTITSADLVPGSPARVRYRVVLEGSGFGSGNGPPDNFPAIGSYMLSVGYFGSSSSNQIYDDFFLGPGGTVDLDFTDTAAVVLDEGMEFEVQLIATAQVSQPSQVGSYEAEMDISRTFRWGGITEVTDILGNPISFEISSDSGVDWVQPAPEPGAGLLAGIALLSLALLRRQSGRRNRVENEAPLEKAGLAGDAGDRPANLPARERRPAPGVSGRGRPRSSQGPRAR